MSNTRRSVFSSLVYISEDTLAKARKSRERSYRGVPLQYVGSAGWYSTKAPYYKVKEPELNDTVLYDLKVELGKLSFIQQFKSINTDAMVKLISRAIEELQRVRRDNTTKHMLELPSGTDQCHCNLLEWMDSNNITAKALSEAADFSIQSVYRITSGKVNVTKTVIDRLIAVTGLSYEDMFRGL